jgi:hypothetical protein
VGGERKFRQLGDEFGLRLVLILWSAIEISLLE